MRRFFLVSSTIAIAAAAIFFSTRDSFTAEPRAPDAAPAVPKITISRETTYVTDPLRPDGYPDYIAAFNRLASEGVTLQNNAAVLLFRAIGPNIIHGRYVDANYVEKLCREFGVERLPNQGDYLVEIPPKLTRWRAAHPEVAEDSAEYRSIADKFWDQEERALQRPWTTDEFPDVAEWVEVNEKPLDLVAEATRRPKFYWPAIAEGESNMLIGNPGTTELPSACRTLCYLYELRAMQRSGEGKIEAAWQDLLACQRLGRLLMRGPSLVLALTGSAIEAVALASQCSFAHYVPLTADQAAAMQIDLTAFPHLGEAAEKMYLGERLTYLDTVLWVARDCPEFLLTVFDLQQTPLTDSLAASLVIDWDRPLRKGNEWFDQVVTIARIPNSKEKLAKSEELERALVELGARAKDLRSLSRELAEQRPLEEIINARVADGFVAYGMRGLSSLLSSYERQSQQLQMAKTALALAGYRADHKSYPDRLEQLVPGYLERIPKDAFSADDTPIRYRRDGDAYVLWSVGPNGLDEGGRIYDDPPVGDDFVMRPTPAEKRE